MPEKVIGNHTASIPHQRVGQVTTISVGPGNIAGWKLIIFHKFEFEERGCFGATKNKLPQDKKTQVTLQVYVYVTPGNTRLPTFVVPSDSSR